MNRCILALFFLTAMPLSYCVQGDADLDNYLNESERFIPDKRERAALNSLKRGMEHSASGVSSRPGEVVFSYGQGHHSVVCAVLELCDVALEGGEHILSVQIGDSSRWSVDTAISGSGENEVEHLIIKPYESNLKTSLMISTDRRAYHLSLRSSVEEYMPSVRFMYPDDRLGAFSNSRVPLRLPSRAHDTAYRKTPVIEQAVENAAVISDDFEITGDEEICPLKVVYDGRRTVITMRGDLTSMPVLTVNGTNGGVAANYRLLGNDYIVDGMIRSATLRTVPADGNFEAVITYIG